MVRFFNRLDLFFKFKCQRFFKDINFYLIFLRDFLFLLLEQTDFIFLLIQPSFEITVETLQVIYWSDKFVKLFVKFLFLRGHVLKVLSKFVFFLVIKSFEVLFFKENFLPFAAKSPRHFLNLFIKIIYLVVSNFQLSVGFDNR